jgi:hypothetical protein
VERDRLEAGPRPSVPESDAEAFTA